MKFRFILLFLFVGTFSFAQENKDTDPAPLPIAQVFESKQSVTIDGNVINLKANYDAGHMMYIHLPSAKLFREDLKKFIVGTLRK